MRSLVHRAANLHLLDSAPQQEYGADGLDGPCPPDPQIDHVRCAIHMYSACIDQLDRSLIIDV
jgi:hypothetical protein